MALRPSFPFTVLLLFLPCPLHSQQPYTGLSFTDCATSRNSTSLFGYFCSSLQTPSCNSYLTFHSQPPYTSVSSISSLLSSDPSLLSDANSVSPSATFPNNTKVLVPVNCSCSNNTYYQSSAPYLLQPRDTPFVVANYTFQGLTTCRAIIAQNKPAFSSGFLHAGDRFTIPLRCACPTATQKRDGVKFLLTYLVDPDDTIYQISSRFGVTQQSVFDANQHTSPRIYPYTTLLIPLQEPPTSSQVAPSPPPLGPLVTSSSSDHTGVYIGIGVAAGVLILVTVIVIIYCVFMRKAKKRRIRKQAVQPEEVYEDVSKEVENKETFSKISKITHALRVYKIEELQLATENFSCECRIAGSVYRGDFNGDVAAVKMMSRDVSGEIDLLKRISHSNVISLRGVCFDQGRWYLVYEYVHHGSLQNWLFDKSGSMVLSWVQRMQIALDVANGLNYLHSYTKPAYVHKDVNSSNVLIDEKFRGKITNFGHARPAEEKEGELKMTRHIVGMIGYMAPEYLEHGFVSPMLDVYAFGAVMMEIITGRGVADHGSSTGSFIAMLGEDDVIGKLGGLMDPLLEGNYPVDLALIVARLIEGCLKEDAWSRPSMEEISRSLSRTLVASQSWEGSSSTSEPTSFSSETEPLNQNAA